MTVVEQAGLDFTDKPVLPPRELGYRDGYSGRDSQPYDYWTDDERRQYRLGWLNGFMAERRETATAAAQERRADKGKALLPW